MSREGMVWFVCLFVIKKKKKKEKKEKTTTRKKKKKSKGEKERKSKEREKERDKNDETSYRWMTHYVFPIMAIRLWRWW